MREGPNLLSDLARNKNRCLGLRKKSSAGTLARQTFYSSERAGPLACRQGKAASPKQRGLSLALSLSLSLSLSLTHTHTHTQNTKNKKPLEIRAGRCYHAALLSIQVVNSGR